MRIKNVSKEELRHMSHQEGLILQGCGGNLKEWLEGINQKLAEEKILLEGTKFTQAVSFLNEGRINLLFLFTEDVKLNLAKLAIWRLQTHAAFGSTWLSDYVPNRIGGFVKEKPDCPLIGEDGNVFNLIGIVRRTLREHGLPDQADEFCKQAYKSKSYNEVLTLIGEYVNITAVEGYDEGMEDLLDNEEGMGIKL